MRKERVSMEQTPKARAAFWLAPRNEHMHAPLPGVGAELPSKDAVDDLCEFLKNAGYEPLALEVQGWYVHRVMPSVAEHWRTSEVAEERIKHLEGVLEQRRQERDEAAESFVRSMAAAGLPLQPAVHEARGASDEPTIGLALVEQSLKQDCARHDVIAGRFEIEPVHQGYPWMKFIVNLLLPVSVGIVFGINLAVLTGFLDLETLSRGKGVIFALIGSLAGVAIEATAGACFAALGWMLATAREPNTNTAEGTFPRHKWHFSTFILLLLPLLLIAAGIVTVDALGLKALHEERLRADFENVDKHLQPLWVYITAGAVISLPYLIFKFIGALRSSSDNLRRARIAHLAQKYLSERRQNPSVCDAYAAAQKYQDICYEINRLEAELRDTKVRHDRARDAASEEATQFIKRWDEIIQLLNSQRLSHAGLSDNQPRNGHPSAIDRLRAWWQSRKTAGSARGDGYLR